MVQMQAVNYQDELASLITLVQSGSEEGNQVIDVLKTGDEGEIRHMLTNFGNPEDSQWGEYTSVLQWTDEQITQAAADHSMINPGNTQYEMAALAAVGEGKFWGW
jgi:hypothetical protein